MCQQAIAIRYNSSTRNATSKILGQPNAHPWLGQRSPYSANPEMLGQQTIFSASLQDPWPANYSANFSMCKQTISIRQTSGKRLRSANL